MASPTTLKGGSFGPPFMYKVHAKGVAKYTMAGIESISLDKGGTDTQFNIFQQPMTVNVRITVRPLATESEVALENPDSVYNNVWYETPKTIIESMEKQTSLAQITADTL